MAADKKSSLNLELYYFPTSFYSQKGLMSLYEKKLPFKQVIVNIRGSENYEPWYFKINPKGQVPVLKDGEQYIPDSARIAKHLDDKYGGIMLLPDVSTEVGQRVKYFVELLDGIPMSLLTYGAACHPDILQEEMDPLMVQRNMKYIVENDILVKKVEEKKEPSMAALYDEKIELGKQFLTRVKNLSIVEAGKGKAAYALQKAEKQLSQTKADNSGEATCLCSTDFSQADIILAVTLHRLKHLGFGGGGLFGNGILPEVEDFYRRVQERPSFNDVCMQATPNV